MIDIERKSVDDYTPEELDLLQKHSRHRKMVAEANVLGEELERAGAAEVERQGYDYTRDGPDLYNEILDRPLPPGPEADRIRLRYGVERPTIRDLARGAPPLKPSASLVEARRLTGLEDPTFADVAAVIGSEEAVELSLNPPRKLTANAEYQRAPGRREVPLFHPFKIDGTLVRSLHFVEPSFQDVEDVAKGRISMLTLTARMAGVSEETIRALRWSDSEVVTLIVRLIAPEMRKA